MSPARTPTGLRNADQLIAAAERKGLKVKVTITDYPPTDLLSGSRSVSLVISKPCPEYFKGTILYNDAQVEDLTVFFGKRDGKGARPRWHSAYRYRRWAKKVHQNIPTLRGVYYELDSMARDVERWKARAAEKQAEEATK